MCQYGDLGVSVFKAGAAVLPAYVKLHLYWNITETEKWKRELLEDEVEGAFYLFYFIRYI